MNLIRKLLVYIWFLCLLSGCIFLENDSKESSFQSRINNPPSKVALMIFDSKNHETFEINKQGDLFHEKRDISAVFKPNFVKTYNKEQYDKALHLAWDVFFNDYGNSAQHNDSSEQIAYKITFGESWNSFAFTILVADKEHIPNSLRTYYEYMLSLNEGSKPVESNSTNTKKIN